MGVDDIGLYLHKKFFDLAIAYGVVQGADGADEFGYDDYIIFLVFCLIEQLAFRAYGRACDESNIVASACEKLTGNKSIFLRSA